MNNNQLKAGAALNYVLIILNSLVGILFTPYLLKMLGQSEFGIYSLVSSVISYLTVLDLGLGNAIVRYTAKYKAQGKDKEQFELFGMFFVLYLIIGIIAFFAGLGLYFNVNSIFGRTMTSIELSRSKIMIFILVINVAVTFPMSIFGSIILAYEKFVFPKILSIIRVLLNTLCILFLLVNGYKAVSIVVVHTIFNLLTLFVNYYYCKYNLKIQLLFCKFKFSILKEIIVYSFWIFLNVIMDKIYWSTGQFVLGATIGTIAVSIYAVSIRLQSLYMQFSTAISSVFLPRVTAMVTMGASENAVSELFIKTGRIQYIVMSFILCGFIIFGKYFIILWAGPEYEDSFIIALLFFFSLLIPLIQNLGITILQARNQMKFRSILYVIIAIIALLFQYILAKRYGAIGCCIAVSGALLVGQGIIMNIYYYKRQKIDILRFWCEIIKMSISPLILCSAFYVLIHKMTIVSWPVLVISICVFTIFYVPTIYFFSMNAFEQTLLRSSIKKVIHK